MSKGLGTIVSAALNIVLSLWLINNYFYDEPFRNYVNTTIGQIYPFLIVSIGVGGGSGLGYVLLKRRHPEQSAASRLQKARLPRQGPFLGSSTPQGRGLGSIVSSTQGTRHTAYAVPSLPKSSLPNSQRGMPTLSWSTSSKASTPGLQTSQSPPSSTPALSAAPPQAKGEASSVLPQISRFDQPPPPISRAPESSPRPSSVPQWRPESASAPERKFEPSGPFVKPGLDISKRPGVSITPGQSPGQGGQQPPVFQPSRWQSPDSTGMKAPQWVDPVPKQGYAPPPKWSPPTPPPPGSGPGIPPPQGGMQRPAPFAPPPRAPFAQPQPPPRPLAYPGAMRPQGQGPFRPEMARPSQGGVPPRPPIQGPRPIPHPRSPPPSPARDRSSPSITGSAEKSAGTSSANEPYASATAESKSGSEGSSAGEMDWDTALDTILKTLRKDKLVEK